MLTRDKTTATAPSRGFSLIELLLSVSLVLMLLGAIAFNFTSFQRGAQLDEGAMRLETLLRFAKAKAASTGKKVQVRFQDSHSSSTNASSPQTVTVELVWEPDPLGQPGIFEKLPDGEGYADSLTDLVSIKEVRGGTSSGGPQAEASNQADAATSDKTVPTSTLADTASSGRSEPVGSGMPSIDFFPDGSSDTARITIASLDLDDTRLTAVHLIGATGELRRRPMPEAGASGGELSEPSARFAEPE